MRGELEAYGAGLEEKPEIVALSKADAVPKDELKTKGARVKKAAGDNAARRLRGERRGRAEVLARACQRGRGGAAKTKTAPRRKRRSRDGGHESGMDRGQAHRRQDRLVAAGRQRRPAR